jgi:hypothetical protein
MWHTSILCNCWQSIHLSWKFVKNKNSFCEGSLGEQNYVLSRIKFEEKGSFDNSWMVYYLNNYLKSVLFVRPDQKKNV